VDRQSVARWLEAYVQAWLTYDRAAIGALFSDDATYAWHPWDQPVRGRAAIVEAWFQDQDAPGTYEGHYEPIAVDGDVAIATGRSRYFDANRMLEREYHNCFVMRFNEHGQCTAFTEWFMQTPAVRS
jgi:ketosteroid isomerase-like protein